ncbi:MAG: hypothetical protein EXQ95_15280 [Alphaproteobacteria bacterium]|nr:hypothetical protein [Alphaproteobacteria bacterium]
MSVLATLTARAEAASGEETAYRGEAARRTEILERARAFAYRRLNLLKKMAATAADEADAMKAADARMVVAFADIGWISDGLDELDEKGRETEARFRPVAEALGDGDEPRMVAALAAFEAWFSDRFGRDFCAVYDRYVPDTPKVDF